MFIHWAQYLFSLKVDFNLILYPPVSNVHWLICSIYFVIESLLLSCILNFIRISCYFIHVNLLLLYSCESPLTSFMWISSYFIHVNLLLLQSCESPVTSIIWISPLTSIIWISPLTSIMWYSCNYNHVNLL